MQRDSDSERESPIFRPCTVALGEIRKFQSHETFFYLLPLYCKLPVLLFVSCLTSVLSLWFLVPDSVLSMPKLVYLAGSAKRLVKAALQKVARKRETRYSDCRRIEKKVQRHFHDDITVFVLFLNHDLIS
ncbi:hypothetical protein POM88_041343 [Heracleum sosnowskyi]|uniref:Uncharacterized protein n=1 Tax=Heracleum sosnowskyi TaxID=360622 RepID=A0AAD8HE12_9APIA|nr:hypothetical protein POM88_041343 [Heracleum sosnowskyi]